MLSEKVSFGYKTVSPEEKRRLVREQFDPIARTYDLADTVLSAGLDACWRKKGIRLLALREGDSVLDLCGGTGDLALLAAARVGRRGRVIICDFNRPMMEVGRRKAAGSPGGKNILWIEGDAENIAFPASCFDAVTVGFGLRNFVHADAGLREIHRVLKPGGKILILEFSVPEQRWLKWLYRFYSFRVMPPAALVICGTAGPFRYLAESIRVFPPPDRVAEMISLAGFSGVRCRRLAAGLAVLYLGQKN